jgi:hypothetical protein
MLPVSAFSDIPDGNDPEVTEYEIGAEPVADTESEND